MSHEGELSFTSSEMENICHKHEEGGARNRKEQPITRTSGISSVRRLSNHMVEELVRRRSSIVEVLPETPTGWIVLVSAMMSALLGYEIQLQAQLTQPPTIFGQIPPHSLLERVYQKLTASPQHILSRTIIPFLFVGTRGFVSSITAYLMGGPAVEKEKYLRFREVMTMTQDGATIAIDWEVPRRRPPPTTKDDGNQEHDETTRIRKGRIHQPVIILLHGINNDASFGYMRSLSRTFVDRGWNAASMNFRGTGNISLSTPRGYNGAYTGDLRCVVRRIAARMALNVPIFLVGNSLGANIMTKYLGEEGLAGTTLPSCVAGAASLGNPLLIDSSVVTFPFNVLMALGVKKVYLENLKSLIKIKDAHSRRCLQKGFASSTIAAFDDATAPIFLRNDSYSPFGIHVGYRDGQHYWSDASSFRHVPHISIPYLNVSAQDDFLVSRPSRNKLGYCLSNPNVMVVETRCGGHLGWQESTPQDQPGRISSSWADVATADFFQAVMDSNVEMTGSLVGRRADDPLKIEIPDATIALYEEARDAEPSGKRNTMHDELKGSRARASSKNTMKEEQTGIIQSNAQSHQRFIRSRL